MTTDTIQPQASCAAPPNFPLTRSDVQTSSASGIYDFIVRDLLPSPTERHQRLTSEQYGLPSPIQQLLGYRSAPELPSQDQRKKWDAARRQNERVDQLSDDKFFDWQIYGKVYDERERRWIHERLLPRPPEITDPYTFIEQELNEKFGPVEGIPGLYIDGSCLKLKTFPPHSRIIPCRVNGSIRALQIYPLYGEPHWYSTPNAPGGAAARASIHIAHEHRAITNGVAVIVAYSLATDAEAWRSRECAIAVNGLSPQRFVREMRSALPELRACAIASELGEVAARTLKENGFEVEVFDQEDAGDE